MKFNDLTFTPHRIGSGQQAVVFFGNGYGASIVQFTIFAGAGSYGSERGLWELAVLVGNDKDCELTYSTDITDDVLGFLSENDVSEVLDRIESLPKAADGEIQGERDARQRTRQVVMPAAKETP